MAMRRRNSFFEDTGTGVKLHYSGGDSPPSPSEPVERPPLPLERVDDVHGRHRLPLGVLGVSDGVADHVLQEDLEDAASLLVDEAGDALDAAPARQAADGRLGDALDVVAEHLAVPLGAALAQALASLAATAHDGEERSGRGGGDERRSCFVSKKSTDAIFPFALHFIVFPRLSQPGQLHSAGTPLPPLRRLRVQKESPLVPLSLSRRRRVRKMFPILRLSFTGVLRRSTEGKEIISVKGKNTFRPDMLCFFVSLYWKVHESTKSHCVPQRRTEGKDQ